MINLLFSKSYVKKTGGKLREKLENKRKKMDIGINIASTNRRAYARMNFAQVI